MNLSFLKSIPTPKMVKDILTDDAGNYVPDKLVFLVVAMAFVGYAGWDLIVFHHAFDPAKYALGAAGVSGGGAGSAWVMSRMQPNKPDGSGQ